MRRLIAIVLSSALAASAAMAADTASLAPGKPAGVKQAQDVGLNTTAWVLLGAGAITAIAIGVASSSNGSPPSGPTNLAVTTTTG
jgi:hypothetical protein